VILALASGCGRRFDRYVVAYDEVALRGVRIVDVDSGRVLPDRTVYVVDGIIRAIGLSQQVALSARVPILGAREKFLIPGLADMHIHHQTTNVGPAYSEDDLLLYLVNGVTTVRNMNGSKRDLATKRRIATGRILGPRYYTCGPMLGRWLSQPYLKPQRQQPLAHSCSEGCDD
jgi:imidazolonepropionase-like amidohydrolase